MTPKSRRLGTSLSEPSRFQHQRWNPQRNSVSPDPSPEQSSTPRCMQTFWKARSVPSVSRSTMHDRRSTENSTQSPGAASESTVVASCQTRGHTRSDSSAANSREVYRLAGNVMGRLVVGPASSALLRSVPMLRAGTSVGSARSVIAQPPAVDPATPVGGRRDRAGQRGRPTTLTTKSPPEGSPSHPPSRSTGTSPSSADHDSRSSAVGQSGRNWFPMIR